MKTGWERSSTNGSYNSSFHNVPMDRKIQYEINLNPIQHLLTYECSSGESLFHYCLVLIFEMAADKCPGFWGEMFHKDIIVYL